MTLRVKCDVNEGSQSTSNWKMYNYSSILVQNKDIFSLLVPCRPRSFVARSSSHAPGEYILILHSDPWRILYIFHRNWPPTGKMVQRYWMPSILCMNKLPIKILLFKYGYKTLWLYIPISVLSSYLYLSIHHDLCYLYLYVTRYITISIYAPIVLLFHVPIYIETC